MNREKPFMVVRNVGPAGNVLYSPPAAYYPN